MSTDESAQAQAFLEQVVLLARELPVVLDAQLAEGEGLPVAFSLRTPAGPDGEEQEPLAARANFAEAFQALAEVPPEERADRLRAHLANLLRTESVIPSWEEAQGRVLLVLRPLSFLHATGSTRLLARRSLPYLAECVALDLGETLTYVTETMLEAWGLSPDELFEVARANVETHLEHQLEPLDAEEEEPRIYRLTASDAYDSSRLISLAWLKKAREALGTDGLICAAPHRDRLLLAIDASPPTLVRLAELAEREFVEAERPISPALYVFTAEGDLGPLELVDEHPLASRMRRGHVLLADAEYAAQKAKLDEQVAAAGVDLHVATFFAAEREGAAFSYCTWSEVGQALLPVVDLVAFAFADPEAAPLVVPFAVAADVAGALWEEVPDLLPTRLRILGFPDEAQLAALAERAVEV